MNETYIVFFRNSGGVEWDQMSIPLTLEKAREFKQSCEILNPDNWYLILNVVE